MFPKHSADLKLARKMIKLWQSEEPPERPVALTPESVLGMAGIAAAMQLPGVCACLLVGFDGFLRTGEMFSLTVGAVTFAGDAAVIALNNTKSLARALQGNTLSEALVIESEVAVKRIKRACKGRASTELLMDVSPRIFRKLFAHMVQLLKLTGKISLYSLRRGGASWHFLQFNNIERTAIRGRWSHTKTARTYVQDCMAQREKLSLSDEQRSLLSMFARKLRA